MSCSDTRLIDERSEADRLMDRIDSSVEHEAAVKQLRALRARQFAPNKV
jgi:hypothetical protein